MPSQIRTMHRMQEKEPGILFHILDVVFNIVVIVAIVVGIRTFLVSPFQVEGSSMLDTLVDKEYIIINKLAYITGDPQRGDVAVLRPPNDESKYYVKRIIGLPGDEIIVRDGYVYLIAAGTTKEVQLDESKYLNQRNLGHTYRNPPSTENTSEVRYKVPANSYFVMGDNREGSYDSRSFAIDGNSKPVPFVSRAEVKGRVWFVALPVSKIHALEPANYGL